MWNNTKKSNIHLVRVPEGEGRDYGEKKKNYLKK